MSARKKLARCFAVAGLFVVQSSLSYAYQWGELELRPWASLDESYDSNITYAHHGALSDFINIPRLGLEGTYTGKDSTATITTSIQEEIYDRYSQFDNLSEYLNATYQKDFSQYDHLTASDSFTHAEDPRTFADEFGRVNGRYAYYDNHLDAAWKHDFDSRLSLQYKFSTEYYNPQAAGLQVSTLYKPGIEADYELSSWLSVLAYDDYSDREFTGFGSMQIESVGAGLRHYWTPQLYLEGRAGEDFISPIVGHDTDRPRYSVSLNDQRDARTLYTLSYTQAYQDTPYTEYLFNSWQVNLEMKKDLTDRLSLDASAFTGRGTYVGVDTKEDLTGASVGVIFHVNKNTDFRVQYGFSDNHSNVSADSYVKHTALLEVIIKF